jgi:hypothetical protein
MRASGFVWGLIVLATWANPAAATEDGLPKRLVIGLDGVAFQDVQKLQQGEGLFRKFHPVSRSISTFPSLSDIAWADIFRTAPPAGYQRYHYSVRGNRIIGGALSDLGNPIEYEKRMHVSFESPVHHAYSYMFSMDAARVEIQGLIRRFLAARGMDTFYVYMLSTDTLQHTDGEIEPLLRLIDRELDGLRRRYRELAGRELEIALISDHGNNHEDKGLRVPFKAYLASHGYRVTDRIEEEKDVVFTCSGILTSVAIFSRESQVEPLVGHLARLKGVDVVTYVPSGSPGEVRVRASAGGLARVRKAPGLDRYAYEPLEGDPLGYGVALERLRRAGQLDEEGFADAEAWIAATADQHYPAAPERIYRGHHVVTMNPARILVSLKDGYENANGFIKFMTHFKKRGGTHGALSARSTNGIVMADFKPTRDLTTNRVASFLGLDGLRQWRREERGARFVDSRALGVDLTENRGLEVDDNLGPQHTTFLNLWDPKMPALERAGVRTHYRFVVKRNGFSVFNRKIGEREFLASSLPHTPDYSEFRFPVSLIVKDHLRPGNYFVKVYARRVDASTGKQLDREKLFNVRFFTDLDGQVVAY